MRYNIHKRHSWILLVALSFVASIAPSHAAVIAEYDSPPYESYVGLSADPPDTSFFHALAQTFVAVQTATVKTLSLYLGAVDSAGAPAPGSVYSFAIELRSQSSTEEPGDLLASSSLVTTLATPNTFNWYDVDFSAAGLELTSGVGYAFVVRATSTPTSGFPVVFALSPPQSYADGMGFYESSGGWDSIDGLIDIPFVVSGTPVPVPAAVWLLISGLGGVVTLTRRRRARR